MLGAVNWRVSAKAQSAAVSSLAAMGMLEFPVHMIPFFRTIVRDKGLCWKVQLCAILPCRYCVGMYCGNRNENALLPLGPYVSMSPLKYGSRYGVM